MLGNADAGRNAPEFDKKEQQGFCSFFFGLAEPEPDTIRLFERGGGDWYSFHGNDALYVAQNVYKTTTSLKYWGAESQRPLPTCTLSRSNTENFVRDLLVSKQYRVEMWTPTGRNSWKIGRKASPGNLGEMEDFLFAESDLHVDPVVAAVKLSTKGDQKLVGVGFADASARKLGCCEFVDNDLYSNFESMLIQINAKELVVPSDEGMQAYDLNKLKQAADRCGCVVTLKKKSDFSGKDVEQDLSRLLPDENVATLPQFELRLAIESVGCLIKYLGLMSDESNFGQFSITTHDLTQYVRLDAAAVRSLNLAPSPASKTISLFSLLNNCKTSQGTRLLAQYIKQPLISVPEITERQDLVEALVLDQQLRQTLQERHLKLFPDLHRIGKKFQRGKAKLEDVVRIYQVVCHLPGLKDALLQYDAAPAADPDAMVTDNNDKSSRLAELIHTKWISQVTEISGLLDKFRELVEATIDLEAIDRHEFLIRATYDSALEELKEKMDEAQGEMEPELNRVSRELDTGKAKGGVKLENRPPYGYHFRLAKSESGAIRNDKRYIELTTQKAGVLFTTKKLQECDRRYREATADYEAKQSTLASDVIDVAASYFGVLERLNATIANLDVICSFAQAAVTAPTQWVRPQVHVMGSKESRIAFNNLRHPLLETTTDYIPNDVSLEPSSSSFQIITGPNMGGKSTFIRSVAIGVIMAQMGCFVPADKNAEVGCVDAVYCRVGAGDNQMRGASTFMMEMIETATILKSSTQNSLIVIDELGRGTSTYDGFGLAYAISQHIATNIKCYCMFATHFHELTVLGDEIPTVKNLNVTAHVGDGQLTLLYKVREGVCDQSFGIHVAELAQFPDSVVKLAKRKAAELEDFSAKGDGSHPHRVWQSTKHQIDEGTDIIRSFLEEFAAMGNPMELDSDQVANNLGLLKEKYKGAIESSPFVREVLTEL